MATWWERFRANVANWFSSHEDQASPAQGEKTPPDALQGAQSPSATPATTQPAPTAQQAPPALPAAPQATPAQPAQLYYTKASIVLSGMEDPYNPKRTEEAVQRNRLLAESSAAGQVHAISKKLITSIPGVGAVVSVLTGLLDLIGDAIARMSKGGFDDLPLLAKQRIAIYFWGTVGKQYKVIPSATFQQLKPDRSQIPNLDEYKAQYARWLRAYLINAARVQQYSRIAKTADEPMLPVEKINALYAAELWPPPLEPLPLTFEEWRRQYPNYLSRGWAYYNPPTVDRDLTELTQATYRQLVDDYREDAIKFATATRDVVMPEELGRMVGETDMVPTWGSPGNPLRVSQSRLTY